jgi:hypothetical protein
MEQEHLMVTVGILRQVLLNVEYALRADKSLESVNRILDKLNEFNSHLIVDPPVGAMDVEYRVPTPWPPIDSCGT